MIVSIHQPNFLPWLGFFYKIYRCDIFVFLDNVQFTKNSFQNRCKIKTPQGVAWLTEPVLIKKKFGQFTDEVEFNNRLPWRKSHLKTLEMNYKRAPYFERYFPKLEEIYLVKDWKYLSEFNIELIKLICKELSINKRFESASQIGVEGKSTSLLIDICRKLNTTSYLSGEGGAKYQEEEEFKKANIKLIYSDFKHSVYPQLWGEFVEGLSILDLLFNCGDKSVDILTKNKR